MWTIARISHVEELKDAVRDAGLEAVQLSKGALHGGLAFAQDRGVVFSSGLINGRVALRGTLSPDLVTFGVALRVGSGSRHWGHTIGPNFMGLFQPGDEHDAVYGPGSLYLAASISHETLHALAEAQEFVINKMTLGGTGIHPERFPDKAGAVLARQLGAIHAGTSCEMAGLRDNLLAPFLPYFSRPARRLAGPRRLCRQAIILRRARDFIHAHISCQISIEDIARAAETTPRTLYRTFGEQLDDTPLSYLHRLRLHHIREDLLSGGNDTDAISRIHRRWGFAEPGRASGMYFKLFGELPSATRQRRNSDVRSVNSSN